jgi:glucokinase
MILAGDIGGTYSRLALFDSRGGRPLLIRMKKYLSRNYLNLKQVVQEFMGESGIKVESACFGIAGPVIQGRVAASNLSWVAQDKVLQEVLNTHSVWLLNDLEATSYGIDELGENDLFELSLGQLTHGNRAILSTGTGLGEALSAWYQGIYIPLPSEGGHSDFSPKNSTEMEFCEFLSQRFGHVSWERVLSGPGIFNLYQFLQTKKPTEEPSWLSQELKEENPSIAIMRAAESGESQNCQKARDLFIQFLGREAGNLALKGLATGGVYLGGGIAPRITALLKGPSFLNEFTAKGE